MITAPNQLTLTNVLHSLRKELEDWRYWQIEEPDNPDYGAIYNPAYGCADNKASSSFITSVVYYWLATGGRDQDLLERANLAASYLLQSQRPSGNIDLLSVNPDSGPDTGFTVQQLCTIFELGQAALQENSTGEELLAKLATFIRNAVSGMREGGFHTPNHRWVIVSALVQAKSLFPEVDVEAIVQSYLAEGIDIDSEGCYIERSVGVYDAVNNRSLLFIAEHWDCPDALPAVQRSLDFDLYLLHADGSAETGLSRRQDYGTREVALGLVGCYLHADHLSSNPHFVRAAQWLWEEGGASPGHLLWTVYALLRFGDPTPSNVSLPTHYNRHFPLNGLWRVRQNRLSTSFFKGVTRLMSMVYGQAELSSLKISLTYFGSSCGRFFADEMTVDGTRGILRNEGERRPRRPGYELPLGRPVLPEQWDETFAERQLRSLPPLTAELTVEEVTDGFDMRYHLLDGLPGIASQIAFDFAPGGIWETADTRMQAGAGDVIFLKHGYGEMRYGSDVIRIGPGAMSHSMWQMRDAEPAPQHVRILKTFWTPVDHEFQLRAYRGLHR